MLFLKSFYLKVEKNHKCSKVRLLPVSMCFILLLLFIFSMGGCSSASKKNMEDERQEMKQPITSDDLLEEMTNEEKCWMGIAPEDYLEDFDFLYEELKSNYPFFGLVQRQLKINFDDLYEDYRQQIKACKNDDDFWTTVRTFIRELEYTGHITVWGYRYMYELADMKAFVEEFPQDKETLDRYIKKLDNPVSQRNYRLMQEFYEGLEKEAEKRNNEMGITEDEAPYMDDTEILPNVTTKILEEDKIAYVKIDAFDMNTYKEDTEILFPFYEKVQNYEHIIIDITNNYGGGMDYFNDLVVAPLANKTYSVTAYLLARAGENNKYFLNMEEGIKEGIWMPVSQLPELEYLNEEDIKKLDYFMKETYSVNPNEEFNFRGKVWLLVSASNYSSSEYAAMFSKQSGFATLVGEQTGGDGIGVDPVYIILPNSGLVVQYSSIYGITPDGKNSEEYGTEPNYYRNEGETALDTCLRLIQNE